MPNRTSQDVMSHILSVVATHLFFVDTAILSSVYNRLPMVLKRAACSRFLVPQVGLLPGVGSRLPSFLWPLSRQRRHSQKCPGWLQGFMGAREVQKGRRCEHHHELGGAETAAYPGMCHPSPRLSGRLCDVRSTEPSK